MLNYQTLLMSRTAPPLVYVFGFIKSFNYSSGESLTRMCAVISFRVKDCRKELLKFLSAADEIKC